MHLDLTAPAGLCAGLLHRRVQQPWRVQHPHRLCGAGGAQYALEFTVPGRCRTHAAPCIIIMCICTYAWCIVCSVNVRLSVQYDTAMLSDSRARDPHSSTFAAWRNSRE